MNTQNESSTSPLTSRSILNQCIWHNVFLKIDNKTFYFRSFAEANLNYVFQFFSPDGLTKNWITIKNEFGLQDRDYFNFRQIIHSFPSTWKTTILESPLEHDAQYVQTQGILQCSTLFSLEKLTSKQLYWAFIRKKNAIPTARNYYSNIYDINTTNWLQIYVLPRKLTQNSYYRMFQYKILNNILYPQLSISILYLFDSITCKKAKKNIKNISGNQVI